MQAIVRHRVCAPALGLVFLAAVLAGTPKGSQASAPIRLFVDASQAPQKIYHVKETIGLSPGPFSFVYPKWIPGFHGPVGPLTNFVNLRLSANGAALPWRRDLVDFYAMNTIVPPGADSIEIAFDVIGTQGASTEIDVPSTANIVNIQWSSFLVYPRGALADTTMFSPAIRLPASWNFASALKQRATVNDIVSFEPVSLTRLVDSPLDAAAYFREIDLSPGETPAHFLDLFSDSAAALEITPAQIEGYRHLIREGPALYGDHHYRSYRFLLTLSDEIGFEGIEHHESSDNRAPEKFASEAKSFVGSADLLPHEYSHSWNGKYRRPADLLTPDFQVPEKTDLLWVYEGLNQYLGEVLTARSRLISPEEARETLAIDAAAQDSREGRKWRSLRDVADEAPVLYVSSGRFSSLRRSAGDFYAEGALIWLEVDTIIRRQTNGRKSLDDFCHTFHGGPNTGPMVKPYVLNDVFTALAQVAPYDWAQFFAHRIDVATPRAPLGGIEQSGWRLIYKEKPSAVFSAQQDKSSNFLYSLGFTLDNESGEIADVIPSSPTGKAGLAPGMKLLAIDGRKWSIDLLHTTLKQAKSSGRPIELLVASADFYKTLRVEYYGGDRYPTLERDPRRGDLLSQIFAPRTFHPKPEPKKQSTAD